MTGTLGNFQGLWNVQRPSGICGTAPAVGAKVVGQPLFFRVLIPILGCLRWLSLFLKASNRLVAPKCFGRLVGANFTLSANFELRPWKRCQQLSRETSIERTRLASNWILAAISCPTIRGPFSIVRSIGNLSAMSSLLAHILI